MKGMKAILLLEGLELVDAFIIYYIEHIVEKLQTT